MTRRKKTALIIVSIITLIVIVLTFFTIPRTVLKYKSDDGKVSYSLPNQRNLDQYLYAIKTIL